MIDATELRIGNWVYVRDGKSKQVTSISSAPRTAVICTTLDHCDWAESHFSESAVSGIPLTEEWVLNFGFEKHHTLKNEWLTMYISEEDGIGVFLNIQDMIIYYCNDPIFRIKHVHDLQNFMFALTGEELVLKKQLK